MLRGSPEVAWASEKGDRCLRGNIKDKSFCGIMLTRMQGVVSLELLTVFVVGPMACLVCYDIAKKNPRANILMIILATAELYGGRYPFCIAISLFADRGLGFMTFCPEWLTGNVNLDSSNFMYLWVYLVFFNMLWVFIPFYAIYVASTDIFNAFRTRSAALATEKLK